MHIYYPSRHNIFILYENYLHLQKSQSQDGGGTSSVSDKRVTLRAVKNFMKIGRSRHTSKERGERDSSTEDERR